MTDNLQFTVLEGGRKKLTTINTLTLAITQNSSPPLPIDVRVFEEDTHLVLTNDGVIHYTEEHPIRLMTEIMETKPKKPGSIITNNARWYAIIHDLDAEPSWQLQWIKDAYLATLRLGETKRVQKLGLPLLGSVHGDLPPEQSLKILVEIIKSLTFQHLKNILLLVPSQDCEKIKKYLHNIPPESLR